MFRLTAAIVLTGIVAGAVCSEPPHTIQDRAKAKECEVTCESGYYACCLVNTDGEPVCRCRRNGSSDGECQGGGPGARHCKITINTQGIYTSTTTLDNGTVYDNLVIDVGSFFLLIGHDSIELLDK